MEIRKLATAAERLHYAAICAVCFLDGRRRDLRTEIKDAEKAAAEAADTDEALPYDGAISGSPTWGVFINGKMQSATVVNDYTIRMNGADVKMGGIGGVVTLPEARGQGLIRRLMRPIMDDMRESGQIYSFLYPFSYDYYRKFGYELCYDRRTAKIPMEQFAKFPYPAKFIAHEPGDDWTPYSKIYDAFIKDRNLAVVRKEASWKWLLNRDPYKDLKFTYLNYGADGEPNAYLLYDRTKIDGANYISVRELAWTSVEGLHSIFGFFGRMAAEYRGVQWNIPDGVNIQAILPNPYAIDWKINAIGMNRIVDVEAVLALHPAPTGTGRLAIGVTDAFYPDNTGLYRLEWESNNLSVTKKAETFITADVETNVTTLAQLTTGYIDAFAAQYRQDTVIRSGLAEMAALFPRKDLYLLEGF